MQSRLINYSFKNEQLSNQIANWLEINFNRFVFGRKSPKKPKTQLINYFNFRLNTSRSKVAHSHSHSHSLCAPKRDWHKSLIAIGNDSIVVASIRTSQQCIEHSTCPHTLILNSFSHCTQHQPSNQRTYSYEQSHSFQGCLICVCDIVGARDEISVED